MNDTFLLYNFDRLWAVFGEDRDAIICLSQRDISIILSALRFASWPSRWIGDNGRLLRNDGRLSDLELALTYVEQLEDNLMSNCADGLLAIAAALQSIADRKCCGTGGAGSVGGVGTGGAGSDGQAPTSGVAEGVPPAGYDTWSEFKSDQCAKSHWIINQIETDLNSLQLINFSGLTITGILSAIAGVLVSPIAGVNLFGVAQWLAGMYDSLADVITAFGNAKDDMICAIYNNTTPAGAVSGALEAYNAAVDALSISSDQKAYARGLMASMLTYDAVNRAFEKIDTYSYPAADCSDCNEEYVCVEEWTVHTPNGGNVISDTVEQDGRRHIVLQAVENLDLVGEGNYYCGIRTDQGEGATGCNQTIVGGLISGTWLPINGSYGGIVIPNNTLIQITPNQAVNGFTVGGGGCHYCAPHSTEPFTMEFVIPAE